MILLARIDQTCKASSHLYSSTHILMSAMQRVHACSYFLMFILIVEKLICSIRGQLCTDLDEVIQVQYHQCYVRTSLYFADTSDCLVSFSTPPFIKAHVRYNLMTCVRYDSISAFDWPLYCTMQSGVWLVLSQSTISILEPPLQRYLVLGELQSLST